MNCAIVRVDTLSAVELVARVESDVATRIQYCFTVVRRGEAGETTVAEMGTLEVLSDIPAEFGQTSLTIRSGNDFKAHLLVTWDGGRMECELNPSATH